MPPLTLRGAQVRYLRGLAHALKPVVQLGHAGLTAAVLRAIDEGLLAHELIKVRLSGEDREARAAAAVEIVQGTGAAQVQLLGHVLSLYRPHPDKPRLQLP
jgi:RNA-binding protein